MAMTPPSPTPLDQSGEPTRDAYLDAAIGEIRARTDTRWVAIADRVRTRALQSTRRSLPVDAQSPSGTVHVSEQVIITYLRDVLTTVRAARVNDITIAVGADRAYHGVTIFISARYGAALRSIADTMRHLAATRLRELLGTLTPPVTIATMDVRVEDVHFV